MARSQFLFNFSILLILITADLPHYSIGGGVITGTPLFVAVAFSLYTWAQPARCTLLVSFPFSLTPGVADPLYLRFDKSKIGGGIGFLFVRSLIVYRQILESYLFWYSFGVIPVFRLKNL